jgi:phenylacetaldehyde dehydrogenase
VSELPRQPVVGRRHAYGQLIGGEWVAGGSGTYPVVNPATEQVIAEAPEGSAADVNRAVAAARAAQPGWEATPVEERAALMRALADRLESLREDLLPLLASEMGGTMHVSAATAHATAVARFRLYADLALDSSMVPLPPLTRATPGGAEELVSAASVRRPFGVVGCITASNFPLIGLSSKVAPALAVGNAVVLKPAPQDPLGPLELMALFEEVGFPPGVANVVTGSSPETGRALVGSPDVDMISFTGRPSVGVSIYEAGARTMKNMVLELGGKGAFLLFEDADVEAAVRALASVWMVHSGQVCAAPTRALVHERVYSEVVGKLAELAESLPVGSPFDSKTVVGPVVSDAQRQSIEAYIRSAIDEGATLTAGGGRPPLDKGFYVQPTLFVDCQNSMTAVRDEIFGPVITVLEPFRDDDEAVELANDTPFGLVNYIYTRDLSRAWSVAGRLQAGNVFINNVRPRDDVPFGGRKMSGIGREGGRASLESFTEQQGITWVP